ncbi:MAG: rod shape-determining protein MreC [Hyphomonas sp.]
MALFGGQSHKPGKRSAKRLALFVCLFGAAGLVVIQSAPQVRDFFVPVRTAAGDRLVHNDGISLLGRITGQARNERRIKELEVEVRQLSRYKAAAISMSERLEAYEDILNLMGEPPESGVTARITAESDGPFSQTLLANAGRAQGVKPGAVALNEGGLVGRVIHLGEHSSRIIVITDFNSRVPVMGEVSGVRAIMRGSAEGVGVLTDLPEQDSLIEGERVLTSAEGGAYPRGLVVGQARMVNNAWKVRFAMAEYEGGYVQMVPPPRIPKPVAEEDLPGQPGSESSASPSLGARQ